MDRLTITPDGSTLQLFNGRFIDVIGGRYYPDPVSLVIQQGRIAAMPGLPGEPEVRADVAIDLQGKTVLPGLINAHTHIQFMAPSILFSLKVFQLIRRYKAQQLEKRMTDCLEHGVTILRDCSTFGVPLSTNRALKQRIEREEILGPRIYQAVVVNQLGGFLADEMGFLFNLVMPLLGMGTPYTDRESSTVAFPAGASTRQIRDAVDEAIDERGADYIKAGEQSYQRANPAKASALMSLEQLETVVDQAERRGKKTTIHQVEVNSFRRAVKAGIHSLAHMPGDNRLDEADLQLFMDSRSLIEPTLSGLYIAGGMLKGVPASERPGVARFTQKWNEDYPYLVENYWIPELRASLYEAKRDLEARNYRKFLMPDITPMLMKLNQGVANWIENTARLIEAGALSRMSIANDGGFAPICDGSVDIELGLLDVCCQTSNRRLKGIDALRVATINGARSMGLEADFGSIDTGKVADLVIMDGDPLDDFRLVGRPVAALFKAGKLVINHCHLSPVDTGE